MPIFLRVLSYAWLKDCAFIRRTCFLLEWRSWAVKNFGCKSCGSGRLHPDCWASFSSGRRTRWAELAFLKFARPHTFRIFWLLLRISFNNLQFICSCWLLWCNRNCTCWFCTRTLSNGWRGTLKTSRVGTHTIFSRATLFSMHRHHLEVRLVLSKTMFWFFFYSRKGSTCYR